MRYNIIFTYQQDWFYSTWGRSLHCWWQGRLRNSSKTRWIILRRMFSLNLWSLLWSRLYLINQSSLSCYRVCVRTCATGNYLTIPRTEGISTTAIVGRILTHLKKESATSDVHDVRRISSTRSDLDLLSSLIHGKSNFLTTTRMLRLFSENVKVRWLFLIDKLSLLRILIH